jgi:hypothetical protein
MKAGKNDGMHGDLSSRRETFIDFFRVMCFIV